MKPQGGASNITSDAVPASCATTITPACLQALYGIPTTAATQSSNQLGVAGFIEQFANQADLRVRRQIYHRISDAQGTILQTFLTNLRKDLAPTTTFTLQTLDGGQNPQNINEAGIEAVRRSYDFYTVD